MMQSYHTPRDQSLWIPFWTEVQGWCNPTTLSGTEVTGSIMDICLGMIQSLHSWGPRSPDHFRASAQGWYNPTATSLLPLSGKVFPNHTKLVSKVFELYSGQRLCQYISNLFISTHILELYGSLLHHISNVEILDFYVLRSVMEYWVLCHLYTTLIVT